MNPLLDILTNCGFFMVPKLKQIGDWFFVALTTFSLKKLFAARRKTYFVN